MDCVGRIRYRSSQGEDATLICVVCESDISYGEELFANDSRRTRLACTIARRPSVRCRAQSPRLQISEVCRMGSLRVATCRRCGQRFFFLCRFSATAVIAIAASRAAPHPALARGRRLSNATSRVVWVASLSPNDKPLFCLVPSWPSTPCTLTARPRSRRESPNNTDEQRREGGRARGDRLGAAREPRAASRRRRLT